MEVFTFTNSTLLPSAKDLLLVFPRLAQRAGSFAIAQLPDAVGDISGILFHGGSVIADATGHSVRSNLTVTNTSTILAHTTGAAVLGQTSWTQGSEQIAASMFGMVLHGIGKLKNLGGVFSYLASRWALATFTAAIILNRAQFYASSRQHLQLRWYVRLSIYLIPIAAFLYQMHNILQTLKCQTSPDYALYRHNDPSKTIPMEFGGEGGLLYSLSSTALWWKNDTACCEATRMGLSESVAHSDLKGSMSLLFGFFITLCVSQLFDTLACALQGKQVVPETGMTIFEHSLAFAECEAMVSSAVGLGLFGLPKLDPGVTLSPQEHTLLFTRGEILQRLNIPPEVLLVCLISCLSHMSSASLAIAGIRDKVRLVNTGVWACCYMAAFLWSFFRVFSQPLQSIADLGILRFPTVCIVGFIPHVFILTGIVICGIIYGVALILTAVSVPDSVSNGMTFQQRLQWAYRNLQANVQFSQNSNIRIKMSEDFYTTILKIGFNVLTAASEAVYLNEGIRIRIAQTTWLEEKRLDELTVELDQRRTHTIPLELTNDEVARGVDFVDHGSNMNTSPYARERRSKRRAGEISRSAVEIDSGLGLTQRKSRMQLTFEFVAGLFWLTISIYSHMLLSIFRRLGIQARPAWLLRAAGVSDSRSRKTPPQGTESSSTNQAFWIVGPDGNLKKAEGHDVDVEVELRKRDKHLQTYEGEDRLSESLYQWWTGGGWFGDLDATTDYQPSNADDDTTSMISMSTNTSQDDWYDDDDDGRRTPTQSTFGQNSRESTPGGDVLEMHTLARLLDPRTTQDQEEARMLSHSLRAGQPMTRSRYRKTLNLQRAEVIRGSAIAHDLEDEESQLERFILEQREKARSRHIATGTWETGAAGMGETGPQCVVCQSTPRTILVWPCGCLSMCDDCRVGLAARNFTKCICCRTDIAAYSRLFVP